jgi:pimeloyl-[acyl-carrier protein] methyl ester esterase
MRSPRTQTNSATLEEWADEMSSEIPAGSVLIGWSLGAMLAMSVAARHPELVSRLVLIAATPSFLQREDWPHALDAATVQAFHQNFVAQPERTMERFIALQALGDQSRHEIIEQLRVAQADPVGDYAALAHGLRLLEQTDLRNVLPAVSLRCLLIHGEQDALIPSATSEWLAQRWSSSEQFRMPGVGHAPHLSQPDVLAKRIEQFLHAD